MAITRRAFLKLTALAAGAAVWLRLRPVAAAPALPPGCEPQTESAVPLSVPMAVGAECVYPTYLPQVHR